MKTVLFNKNFNGNVLLSGAPKSGKNHCVSTIIREALKAEKNILWISSEEVFDYIEKIRDELSSSPELFVGKAYCIRTKNYVLEDSDITQIFHNIEQNGIYPDIMFISDVSFGDYMRTAKMTELFRKFCRNHNIYLVYSVQSSSFEDIPKTMLYSADFSYQIGADDADIDFEGFEMREFKKHPVKADIFLDAR